MVNRTVYVAFLRGVNIGGKRPLKMAPLRQALLSSASSASSFSRTLERVVTHLASGNLILTYHGDGIHDSDDCATDEVESFILQVLQKDFGYKDIPVMVRTMDELRQALQDNPLPGRHKGNGPYFAWLNRVPDECYIKNMAKIDYSPETYVIHKGLRLIYFSYYQKCKLDTTIFEMKLQVVATNRNHRTIHHLVKMATDREEEEKAIKGDVVVQKEKKRSNHRAVATSHSSRSRKRRCSQG